MSARPRHAAAKDAEIRALLAERLSTRDDLSSEQRGEIVEQLLPVVWEAVRIKRPTWRPADHDVKHAVRVGRIQDVTRSRAEHHNQPWTSEEIELLTQGDQTDEQLALATGRTLYAVKTKLKKLRAAEAQRSSAS